MSYANDDPKSATYYYNKTPVKDPKTNEYYVIVRWGEAPKVAQVSSKEGTVAELYFPKTGYNETIDLKDVFVYEKPPGDWYKGGRRKSRRNKRKSRRYRKKTKRRN